MLASLKQTPSFCETMGKVNSSTVPLKKSSPIKLVSLNADFGERITTDWPSSLMSAEVIQHSKLSHESKELMNSAMWWPGVAGILYKLVLPKLFLKMK